MSVKLSPLPSTEVRGVRARGPITLRHYAVLVDGEKVGTVYQHRAESTHRYSGATYGYNTQRTAWAWDSEDNAGMTELGSRKEALADLLDYLGIEA